MIQKCSLIAVLEVFFKEPTSIHFVREIGRKISLAQTSVRNHIKELEKNGLVVRQESKPFDGLVANRENEKFIFYKRVYNMHSLCDLKDSIVQLMHPRAIIVFGSYQRGEDMEKSDIDILVLSRVKKEINLKKFEKLLNRKININFVNNLKNLDLPLRINILSGLTLYGGINEGDI
ncbi:nucleotidyltransferase domain-containing protein [Candidatus Pacearchaeota archaeon]|nr:nucleotidyltransferase domain-containing protein [Candidatus Pacearchaeota archaeon]